MTFGDRAVPSDASFGGAGVNVIVRVAGDDFRMEYGCDCEVQQRADDLTGFIRLQHEAVQYAFMLPVKVTSIYDFIATLERATGGTFGVSQFIVTAKDGPDPVRFRDRAADGSRGVWSGDSITVDRYGPITVKTYDPNGNLLTMGPVTDPDRHTLILNVGESAISKPTDTADPGTVRRFPLSAIDDVFGNCYGAICLALQNFTSNGELLISMGDGTSNVNLCANNVDGSRVVVDDRLRVGGEQAPSVRPGTERFDTLNGSRSEFANAYPVSWHFTQITRIHLTSECESPRPYRFESYEKQYTLEDWTSKCEAQRLSHGVVVLTDGRIVWTPSSSSGDLVLPAGIPVLDVSILDHCGAAVESSGVTFGVLTAVIDVPLNGVSDVFFSYSTGDSRCDLDRWFYIPETRFTRQTINARAARLSRRLSTGCATGGYGSRLKHMDAANADHRVTANSDSSSLTFSNLDDDRAHRTVVSTNAPPVAYTYQSANNYTGQDRFIFRTIEGTSGSNTAMVSVTVTPVNDAPISANGSLTAAGANLPVLSCDTLVATVVDSVTVFFRIRMEPYDHSVLDKLASVKWITAIVHGLIPLPTRIERYTVLPNPHIDKKSREQFEIRTHKRLINILQPTGKTIDALNKLLRDNGQRSQCPDADADPALMLKADNGAADRNVTVNGIDHGKLGILVVEDRIGPVTVSHCAGDNAGERNHSQFPTISPDTIIRGATVLIMASDASGVDNIRFYFGQNQNTCIEEPSGLTRVQIVPVRPRILDHGVSRFVQDIHDLLAANDVATSLRCANLELPHILAHGVYVAEVEVCNLLLDRLGSDEQNADWRQRLLDLLATALLRNGQLKDALQAFNTGAASTMYVDEDDYLNHLTGCAESYLLLGRISDAVRLLQEILSRRQQIHPSLHTRVVSLLAAGNWMHGIVRDIDDFSDDGADSVKPGTTVGITGIWMAELMLRANNFVRAREINDSNLQILAATSDTQLVLRCRLIAFAIALAQTDVVVEDTFICDLAKSSPWQELACRGSLLSAMHKLMSGDVAQALGETQSALVRAKRSHLAVLVIEALLLKAQCERRTHNTSASLKSVTEAFFRAESLRLLRHMIRASGIRAEILLELRQYPEAESERIRERKLREAVGAEVPAVWFP